jgi:hypothetical protein
MGLTWFFDLLSFLVEWISDTATSQFIFVISDIVNLLQECIL